MCDYSLHNVKSRPAKVGDKLITRDFGTGTRGFAASEDANVAHIWDLALESPLSLLKPTLFSVLTIPRRLHN